MKKLFAVALLIFGLGSTSAQSFIKLSSQSFTKGHIVQNIDSVKILAVMVEFQPDKYDGTVGNGKFGSLFTQDYGDTIIDPLPHDSQYFSDHLEFAKNYYRKISNGKVTIAYRVLPDIITVSKTMREYVPGYRSSDLSPLGNFTKEVWTIAQEKFKSVNFSDYNLFMIFHAGVSAGLNLGVYQIDRNMPSLFLSDKSLKEIFGNQFEGLITDNGKPFITNSLILPETESREFEAVDGSIVLQQITFNGALVSNIASFLGLPDLFNTETGTSAIGLFGLMDSQAIYANWGMFPPEPSPWEKMYLGWITPQVADISDRHINIATHLTASHGDTTVLKIPINSSEYFLIENRSQDAFHDNLIITYKRDGQLFTKVIQPDTNGIYYATPDSIPGGVVVDVDEFDAAVPGSGIVIWHIDDNIINAKLPENKINGDLYNKGVDVEEADGTQDIGETFTSIFGDVIGEGSYEDLWFKGNSSTLYKNRFSFDTKPNTNSNTGAKSLITLENFSGISNKMSFDLKFGEDLVKEIMSKNIPLNNPVSISVPYNNSFSVYVQDKNKLYVTSDEDPVSQLQSFNFTSDFPVASINFNIIQYIIGSVKDTAKVFFDNSGLRSSLNLISGSEITSPFVISLENNSLMALAGTADGSLFKFNLASIAAASNNYDVSISKITNEKIIQICLPYNSVDAYFSAITESSFIDAYNVKIALQYSPIKAALISNNQDNSHKTIILAEQNHFYVVSQGIITSQFEIQSSGEISSFSILNDNNLGKQYIVLNNNGKIDVYGLNGVMLENFPIDDPKDGDFTSTPLTTDLNGDSVDDIVAITSNGSFHVFDGKTGKEISPFPISIGASVSVPPFIYRYTPIQSEGQVAQQAVAIIDDNHFLHKWIIGTTADQPGWGSEFGNSMNSSSIVVNQSETAADNFFPEDKAYNWPNPVYNGETNIRYFVSENSSVDIKIFDLAGDLAAELTDNAVGGFDNETKWNVSNIQSGIYYAHLEVKGVSGRTASKIIKIAVIK